MCVYVCVRAHVHVHVFGQVCERARVYVCDLHICVFVCVCVHARARVCAYVCAPARMCTFSSV